MKKTSAIISGTVLALGATGVVANAQADEVTTPDVTSTVQADKQEVKQAEVTQEQVATAKAGAYKAAEAVTNTQAEVTQAQEAVTQSQVAVDNAQGEVDAAQANVANATPETIAKAEQAVTTTTSAIESNTQAITEAKANGETASHAVTAQEAVLNQAKSDVSTAQVGVDNAKEAVAQAQAVVDGTNQADVIAARDEAQSAVTNAQNEVVNAQTALDVAKAEDASREVDVQSAEKDYQTASTNVTTAQKAVAQAEEALTIAQENEESVQDKVNQSQTAYTKAENDYNSINTITLTPEYIEALKNYVSSDADQEQVVATLKAQGQQLRQANTFKANPNDDATTKYDINNLPDSVKQELSLFASDLINQIRTSFGTPQTVVTASSIKFVDMVTAGYVADKWDVMAAQMAGGVGHDAKAVNDAAKYFGLPTTDEQAEAKGWQLYEDAAFSGMNPQQSLVELKLNVYLALKGFLFSNTEWGHAYDIAGLMFVKTSDEDVAYVAVAPTNLFDGGGLNGIHFISIDGSFVKEATKDNFDTTPIVNPNSTTRIVEAYNSAKANLTSAQAELALATAATATAQESKDQADATLVAVNNQLTVASQRLNALKFVPLQTPTAQANLETAKTALVSAQERLVSAQQAVDSLSADIKTKQANLEAAKNTLSEKQDTLSNAIATYNTELTKLNSLEATLKEALQKVADLEEKASVLEAQLASEKQDLSNLKNAPEVLEQAKTNLVEAKTLLASAKALLAEKEALLTELKAKQADLQTRYESLATTYNKQVEKQQQAEVAKQKQTIEAQGKVAVPVVNEKGQIVGFIADEPSSLVSSNTEATKQTVSQNKTQARVSPIETAAITKTATSANVTTLPNTGDTNSKWLPLLGASLAFVSLGGVVRKRRRGE